MAPEPASTAVSHTDEIETWRAERLAALTREDGWLSLVGLFWLEEGENTAGSAEGSDLVFPPPAPERIGTFHRQGEEVRFEKAPDLELTANGEPLGDRITLISDAEGEPTLLEFDSFDFYLIQRGERFGIRAKDAQSPVRTEFPGLDHFPVDPAWRFEARFEAHDPPVTIPVPNVLGTVEESESPGAVIFEVDGESHRIDALPGGEDSLFLVFGDKTNGRSTYGGGRFLYTSTPDARGRVDLDFNKAYNPPCAFTPHATCPLPPPGNKLPIEITAGEKAFGDPHH